MLDLALPLVGPVTGGHPHGKAVAVRPALSAIIGILVAIPTMGVAAHSFGSAGQRVDPVAIVGIEGIDSTAFIFLGIMLSPAIIGLSLSWLSSKGYNWARYTLGSYSILSIIFVLFLPVAQHEVDRTPVFYFLCIISILSFAILTYSLFVNKRSIKHLSCKR